MFKVVAGLTLITSLLYILFFMLGVTSKWTSDSGSSFECGFSSYFFSRFSFSIHYFLVGMIFLFLDLEICLIFPFMSGYYDSLNLNNTMMLFVLILTFGLLYEWVQGKLEWKF